MARTHYQTLGVERSASSSEIRSAYRKLVMELHPDRNPSKQAAEQFLRVTEAYESIGDPDRRRNYDAILDMDARRAQEREVQEQRRRNAEAQQRAAQQRNAANAASGSAGTATGRSGTQKDTFQGPTTVAAEITKLSLIFSRGQWVEAETLAREIIARDPKQALPYAVLGDLARQRGKLSEAVKMYSYAAQMDPRNSLYMRRYEELIRAGRTDSFGQMAGLPQANQGVALIVAALFIVLSMIYVFVAPERPLFPSFNMLSTWTLGLIVMLFLTGVVTGSCLSAGNLLDRFISSTTNSVGKFGPMVALGTVAVVNFWFAAALYAILGLIRGTFNLSATRLLYGVGVTTLCLTIAAALAPRGFEAVQVFLWGGNLVYIGAICGWLVADSFTQR